MEKCVVYVYLIAERCVVYVHIVERCVVCVYIMGKCAVYAQACSRARTFACTRARTHTNTSGTYRQNAPMTVIVTWPGLLHLQCIHRSTLPITDMSHCHEVILTDVQPCHVKSQSPTLGWLKLE